MPSFGPFPLWGQGAKAEGNLLMSFGPRLEEAALWPPPVRDIFAPVVTLISPTNGTTISKLTPIIIDVVDFSGLVFSLLTVTLSDPATPTVMPTVEVVHDGTSFKGIYGGSRTAITKGFRYIILRDGGWPANKQVQFEVHALDTNGNKAT